MPERADAVTELTREHAGIERLVQRIAALDPGPERTMLVHDATARFLSHAEAEERYLLPAFRRYLPGGGQEAVDQERRVHALRDAVESLQRAAAQEQHGEVEQQNEYDADHAVLVGRFVLDAQRHIERQDAVLLPALRDACPREEVDHLGRQLRYALGEERGDGHGEAAG
ncbi:hemerythrin domain-containing protein [Actinospica durhamensis]|uniref:Hemerythrin domain-containing protein n=1 Tax=Actinospica durhamensis TaxID=1508375 RepID=A0A941EN22_9ACTN|nr:hemerythrin domain-containing protein [Actinospica durhamensis]MBR7833388.1 hemerythrin domain-containing protein [Actinospica durhamensis]